MIKTLDWITREMVRAEPQARFVFGDNVGRVGFGGQAKAMRGEPNAIGVITKWRPSMREDAFFSDDDAHAWECVNHDLDRVAAAVAEGRTVYLPKDGLGTGLSELAKRAPKLLAHINARLAAMKATP